MKFYIDGRLDSTAFYSTFFEFFTDLDIGAVNPGFEASLWGDIDELQIYDFALSDSEADFLYRTPGGRVSDVPDCDSSLQRLTEAFRLKFVQPDFKIPGESTAAQVEALVSAILQLNYGQQQALFLKLGGQNAAP